MSFSLAVWLVVCLADLAALAATFRRGLDRGLFWLRWYFALALASSVTVHGNGMFNATTWTAGTPLRGTDASGDTSPVASVGVSILDQTSGKYWNGTGFTSAR